MMYYDLAEPYIKHQIELLDTRITHNEPMEKLQTQIMDQTNQTQLESKTRNALRSENPMKQEKSKNMNLQEQG